MECDNVVIILSMAKSFRRIPSYYGIDMPIHHVFFSSDFSLLSPNVFNRYDVVNSCSLFSTAHCSTIHSTWRRTMPRCISRSRRPIRPCNSSFSFGSTRSLVSPVTMSAGITYRRFPGRCSKRVGVGLYTYLHMHVTVFCRCIVTSNCIFSMRLYVQVYELHIIIYTFLFIYLFIDLF